MSWREAASARGAPSGMLVWGAHLVCLPPCLREAHPGGVQSNACSIFSPSDPEGSGTALGTGAGGTDRLPPARGSRSSGEGGYGRSVRFQHGEMRRQREEGPRRRRAEDAVCVRISVSKRHKSKDRGKEKGRERQNRKTETERRKEGTEGRRGTKRDKVGGREREKEGDRDPRGTRSGRLGGSVG